MKPFVLSVITGVLLVTALAVNAHALFGFGKYSEVDAQNGIVTIPLADVNDGEAHYYSFDVNGTDVKFFLLQSRDGVIRAAFDACDVCYRDKKGYSQEDDFMVCNNCNMKFHSSRINEVKGGCNPSPLNRTLDGNNVIIKVNDILTGRGYF